MFKPAFLRSVLYMLELSSGRTPSALSTLSKSMSAHGGEAYELVFSLFEYEDVAVWTSL